MAAITSAQSGDWATGATWTGGVAPGDGDTATIATGHTVTVSTTVVVGTAPGDNTTNVLTLAGSASLTLSGSLTVKGNLQANSGDLIFSPGAVFVFGVGAGRRYQIEILDGNFICDGTEQSRISFSSSGGGFGRILNLYTGVTKSYKFNYCDFTGVGSTSTSYCIRALDKLEITNCRFYSCGQIQFEAGSANLPLVINNNHCSGGVGSAAISLGCTTTGTGLRELKNNSFGNEAIFTDLRSMIVSGNYFRGITFGSGLSYYATTWEYNFVYDFDVSATVPTIKNEFRYCDAQDNMHFFILPASIDQVIDGCIMEAGLDWTTDSHDGILISSSPASARTYTVQNCITLPSLTTTRSSCTLFTCAVDSNVVFNVKNNTHFSDDDGFGMIAVHWNGVAGMLAYFKDNLGWANSQSEDSCMLRSLNDSGDTPPIANDYITFADYNAAYNLNSVYSDIAANAYLDDASVGVHDITANPAFIDNTRCLSKWSSVILGKTGTKSQLNAAAIAALANMNDPSSASYVAGSTVQGLVDWVKSGFTPTSAAYQSSSSTGSWIGAVEPIVASTQNSISMMMFAF